MSRIRPPIRIDPSLSLLALLPVSGGLETAPHHGMIRPQPRVVRGDRRAVDAPRDQGGTYADLRRAHRAARSPGHRPAGQSPEVAAGRFSRPRGASTPGPGPASVQEEKP